MMLSRALRLVLAAALLAAWQGALVHPIEHVDHAGELVHVPGHSDEEGGGATLTCDAVAAVAACVAGSPLLPAFSPARPAAPASGDAGEAGAPARLAYRSQAPPQHS